MKNFFKIYLPALLIIMAVGLSSCIENYSNGERVGYITQFSQTGLLCKTYEGHLNSTQTGMNSATPFNFSVENAAVASQVEQAANKGYKVKLNYHQVAGLANFGHTRGETNHFVTQVTVLDSIK